MASLFMVLSLCAFVVQRPESVGMMVPLVQVRAIPHKGCDFVSDRSIVAQLHKDRSYWINETHLSHEKLGPIITEIYETRAERVIYIRSDPDVSYGEFANLYNTVDSSISNMHIVLMTPQMQSLIQQCPQGGVCELVWHDYADIICGYSPTFSPSTFRVKHGDDSTELN